MAAQSFDAGRAPVRDGITDSLSRFRGCLLGSAMGDALGAPVEFKSRAQILRRFGSEGVTGMERATATILRRSVLSRSG